MKKIYAAILSIALFFTASHLNAQNTNDKNLLDLVKKNAAQLHLSPFDADNLMISYAFVDSKTNIQYVYLQQAYQNIKVHNSIMTVIFRNNEVLYSSGKFVDNLDIKAGAALASPTVQAEQAINHAAMHLGLPAPLGLITVANKFTQEKKMIFSSAGIAKNNIETELLWVAADDGSWVKLAWNVNIDERRSSDWWNVRIDATTGTFLEKNNWTVHEGKPLETDAIETYQYPRQFIPGTPENKFLQQTRIISGQKGSFAFLPPTVTSADYFVAPLPFESPRHGPMALVHNPWLAAGAANNAITHGWHFDGTTNYNITRGNNVHAYLDVANTNNPASPTNVPVVSTTPDPSLTFNFVPNFTQQPNITLNRQAAVTNLFYMNNKIHDILYQYGFNEVSGNFQADNLGRGGVQGDYVRAEAQDASGTDNANFSTPADGGTPRMQMYLWSGPPSFVVNTPAVIAGNYFATESGFSTANKLINVGPRTGQVVWYNDDASPTPTHFACNGSTPGSLAGKIAMIVRGGGCVGGFVEKVKNAQNNGAIAVIMVNNVPGLPITMGGADNTIIIPAVMVSDVDGAAFAAQLANNVNVTLTGGVGLDGDFDNGIITHEYGHGVSNRLTGGAPNNNCLGNQEQGGEGWSDYLGLMLTQNWATTNLTDGSIPRPIGVYALGHPIGQGGIRTAPYSTNMTISPQSYTALPTMAVPHGIGEIWCSAIWDMTWNIIQQEGVINPNIYDANGTGGNVIALRLVMEGMRLQTCRPGFLDGRDAILAADSILYAGRHKCAIWAAFARRGMGVSANQGSSNSVTDGTAAFDVPSLVQLDKLAGPLTVVQGEMVAVNVTATCQCLINTNYTLRDTIPAGFTYVSSTGGTLAGNVVTFSPLNFSATQETKSFTVVITPNNPGCAITTNINDNRDGSTIGGLASVITTGTTNWVTSTTRASSPTTSWFAASTAANKDFSLTSPAPGFTAGNLSVFSFRQYYITENTIDGGRVEYSVNNGVNWLDAGGFILQNGYNKPASAAPWGAGERIFSGVSFGRGSGQFINTIVDLSSLSGQSVRVRLRSRSNATNNGTYEGWFVDDILQMDGCGGIVKAGLYNGAVRVDSLARPVFIKTGTAVAITTQPVNTTVCAGSNATFTVAADPATSPTYQWQLSTNGGASFADIVGQTSATLIVPSATLAMNGYQYRVLVSSSLSSGFIISNTATLTVNPIPTVSPVPPNQTVCNAALTAPVTFSGPVAGTTFNWVNNTPSIGLAASGTGNIASFNAINGTNVPVTATITVTPVTNPTGIVNFNYTGAVQTWVVPAGVTSVTIQAFGAQGNTNAVGGVSVGGLGGSATGTLAVTPGQTLFINVGGGAVSSITGGFNGGGNAGVNTGCATAQGGGGGGASDVRITANALANRVIVGAGGGGAGGNRATACGRGAGGGGGGGYYGGGGGAAWPGVPGGQGPVPTGGTQVAGGAGGVTTFTPGPTNGFPGALGIGGAGGTEIASAQGANATAEPGGIGGGLTGGSGLYNQVNNWCGQSGAGGSSYIGGVTGGATTSGVRSGNGLVSISYATSGPSCTGPSSSFTITVNPTPNAVATPPTQTICSGTAMTPIVLSGNVSGTTFNWTRDNQVNVTGIPNGGSGNISGTPINNTGVQQTVTFTITPIANGCPGTPITATLIVNKAPAITCPANITVNNTTGQCGANVTYPPATATGSPAPVITYSHASGSFFPVGTTTVTATATNTCGVATCTFTITVLDAQAPTITCPGNMIAPTDAGVCIATVATPNPTTGDNCAVTAVTWVMTGATTGSSPATGINFVGTRAFNLNGTTGQGVTTITYTVRDAAGNSATCSFTVTVNDAWIPVIGGQPVNQTVCVGSDALFSVAASVPAGNPLTYQWQAWNGSAWVNITGATNATLLLPAVTFSMNTNSYRVILTGRCSVVTSVFATLYVNQLPTISIVASVSPVLLPGQSVTLTTVVNPSGGSYQWFKNGVAITGATGSSLNGLTVDDIGSYTARYTDLNGCVATSAAMVVSGQASGNLWIYPNPNTGHFHIRLYNHPNEEMNVRIFDTKGALVYQRKVITGATPYFDIDIDISGDRFTASENYVVNIIGSDGRLIGSKLIQVLR